MRSPYLFASGFFAASLLWFTITGKPFGLCLTTSALSLLYYTLYQKEREIEQLRKVLKECGEVLEQQQTLLNKAGKELNRLVTRIYYLVQRP